MTTNENAHSAAGPEDGATPEAIALHGDEARVETHAQPDDVVTLPGDTRIATGETDEDDDE